jgi:anti-sigma regulatory factor (Ser/Thr protein kinase)
MEPDERVFAGHPRSIAFIRSLVRQLGAQARLDPQTVDDLVLAVSEAANNAVRHGMTARIVVRWQLSPDGIEIEIADDGVFGAGGGGAGSSGEGGLGIPIMRAVADEVWIDPGTTESPGTTVHLAKHRSDAELTVVVDSLSHEVRGSGTRG